MKKNIFYYLFAVVCTMCLFTACSDDDDDNSQSPLIVDNIVGTYKGTLEVLETSIPNTSINVTKVSDSKVKVELKDFTFQSIPIGDISVECSVVANKADNDLDINGTATVTIEALGGISLPVSVTGDATANKLDIDINITNVPLLGTISVEFEGIK